MPRKENLFWRPKGYATALKQGRSIAKEHGESKGASTVCGANSPFTFEYLCQNRQAVKVPDGWTSMYKESSIAFGNVVQIPDRVSLHPVYKFARTVTVFKDLQWTVTVHDNTVTDMNAFPGICPVLPNVSMLNSLLDLVAGSNVCCGNFDEKFLEMVRSKTDVARISIQGDSDVTAFIEGNFCGKSLEGTQYFETIRSKTCNILTPSNRCHGCKAYRSNLRSIWHRKTHDQDRCCPSSRTNMRYLDSKELKERANGLQKERTLFKKSHQRLINQLINQGVTLDKDLSRDFTAILEEKSKEVSTEFKENSFQHLFWEEQLKRARCTDPRQMRWHPTIIRWCLSLKFSSSAAYETLRNSGFVKLPSSRTLNDYSNYIRPEVGVNPKVLEEILAESKADQLEEHQKYVVLLHDEMKIKSDLVFDKNTGQLIGFVNLGRVNEELSNLARCSEEGCLPALATHVLVFMVRGISTRFSASVAYYPTVGCTADNIFPLIWEVIGYLEITCGLKVIASTSDGATWNRKFYKMNRIPGTPKDMLVYKAPNVYCLEERMVYFFSDVPHLIKTARNSFANSEAHRKSRSLWNNGNPILWRHLTQVVTEDQTRDIHILNKIGYEHIELTSFSIMRVNLAAQVLSETVANAIEWFGPPEASETVKFIRYMDSFFDCLNVRNFEEHHRKKKPNLKPYTDPDDVRFEWLRNDFLQYFNAWEQSVMQREGNFPKSARNAMLISKQTIDGLKMTVNSFVDVSRYLLGQGVHFILSERFCQDSLEAHFSKHRNRGGDNNDPTVQAFGYQENSIRLQKSHHLQCITGNTGTRRRQHVDEEIDATPLPKRPRC